MMWYKLFAILLVNLPAYQGCRLFGPLPERNEEYGYLDHNVKVPPSLALRTSPHKFGLKHYYIPVSEPMFRDLQAFASRPPNLFSGCRTQAWTSFTKYMATEFSEDVNPASLLTWVDLNYIFEDATNSGAKCKALGTILHLIDPQAILASNISALCLETATRGEVTDLNFHAVFPKIAQAMLYVDFVALDAEFTGVKKPHHDDENYFQTAASRYEQIKSNLNDGLKMIQLGISMFRFELTLNAYMTSTWKFYMKAQIEDFSLEMLRFHINNKLNLDRVCLAGIQSHPLAYSPTPIGLTQLMQHLMLLRKPIVVYSGITDFAFLISTFLDGRCPSTYHDFKLKTLQFSPTIIDVKYLVEDLVRPRVPTVNNHSLELLFQDIEHLPAAPCEPKIRNGRFHDAGYDAFCTGILFLRICNFLSTHAHKPMALAVRAFLSPSEPNALAYLGKYINRLHFRYTAYPYLNLKGKDPIRPHVYSVTINYGFSKLSSQQTVETVRDLLQEAFPKCKANYTLGVYENTIHIHFKGEQSEQMAQKFRLYLSKNYSNGMLTLSFAKYSAATS